MKNNTIDKLGSSEVVMPSTWTSLDLKSGAVWLACAPAVIRDRFLNEIGEGELCALPYLFEFWAMEHQLPPAGDWRSWVIMGGRGAGKTRAGAEWVRSQVEGAKPLDAGRARRVALVGETFDQVRDVMIFGDSGILACSPPDRLPVWKASERKLIWDNGAEAQAFTAHDPEGLRGPQFDAAWVDELGCAAIDKGTNQPNKFLDPKSSESSLPNFSNGNRDELIQVHYLRAMLGYWGNVSNNPVSEIYGDPMIDMQNAYVWAWDARPYPMFPNNRELWSDGENHARGHWLNGRVGARTLASVVEEVCICSGLGATDTSQLFGSVSGFVMDQVADARTALQPLMLRYGFDAIERDGLLRFVMRNGRDAQLLTQDMFAHSDEIEGAIELGRDAEAEMTGRVRVRFVQSGADHDVAVEETVLPDEATHAVTSSELPLAMTRKEGRQVVERWLTEARVSRDTARFALPPSKMALGAGDVVEIANNRGVEPFRYRIDRVEQSGFQMVEAVRIESDVYTPSEMSDDDPGVKKFQSPVPVMPLFMDLPLIHGDEEPHAPRLAVAAQPWPGSVALYASVSDENYALNDIITRGSVIGTTESPMAAAQPGLWDNGPALQVKLIDGALETRTSEAILNGANLAAIGDGSAGNWELFQFQNAELIDADTYWLSGRLRGQLGSEGRMPEAWPVGSWIVLMDGTPEQIALSSSQRRIAKHYRVGPAQRGYDDPSYVHLIEAFDGNGLRPYAPCHLKAARSSGGDLAINWIRRTRIDGDSWDLPEVPLGEDNEQYVLRVRKGASVLREITVSQPFWNYGSDLQLADGLVLPAFIEVAQISGRYGAGTTAFVDLPE